MPTCRAGSTKPPSVRNHDRTDRTTETGPLVCTFAYVAPELVLRRQARAEADWYSVGVMLYQALTGRLPFTGKFFEVMMNKQNVDPPSPAELVREVPPELNALCMQLLDRDPAGRPTSRDVLRVLGHGKTGPLKPALMPSPMASASSPVPALTPNSAAQA